MQDAHKTNIVDAPARALTTRQRAEYANLPWFAEQVRAAVKWL